MSRAPLVSSLAFALAIPLASSVASCARQGRRSIPSVWHGEIVPRTGVLVPGNARLEYELVLTLDRFEDGHVSGVVEWPSDISRSAVTGDFDGQHLTLVDASGDRKDAVVSVEKRGGCEPDHATLRGTDKNGLWQLTAVADRKAAPLEETVSADAGAP